MEGLVNVCDFETIGEALLDRQEMYEQEFDGLNDFTIDWLN